MTWQRLSEITPAVGPRERKRVPYDMISEYTRDGWVVVERHETYATLEKIGAAE